MNTTYELGPSLRYNIVHTLLEGVTLCRLCVCSQLQQKSTFPRKGHVIVVVRGGAKCFVNIYVWATLEPANY